MELLALIAAVALIGAIGAFLLLRRSKQASAKRSGRHDFLDNPNDWGW